MLSVGDALFNLVLSVSPYWCLSQLEPASGAPLQRDSALREDAKDLPRASPPL